jgi:hypothetical protein
LPEFGPCAGDSFRPIKFFDTIAVDEEALDPAHDQDIRTLLPLHLYNLVRHEDGEFRPVWRQKLRLFSDEQRAALQQERMRWWDRVDNHPAFELLRNDEKDPELFEEP